MENQKEQERKEKFTTVSSLMNDLMMRTGDNAACDYDGVNNLDDVILYLRSHIKGLPSKGIGDKYGVCESGESLEHQIGSMIENDLMDAVREKDLIKLLKIKGAIQGGITMCEEYQEDLMIKLYEARAKVLSRILDFVNGLQFIKEASKTRIHLGTTDPWDDEILEKLREVLEHELPDIDLDSVLRGLHVYINDDHIIIWDWVE